MKKLSIQANAKINLFLNVLGQRVDHYHEIETVLQNVSLSDHLLFEKYAHGIVIESTSAELPKNHANTVYQTARCLQRAFPGRIDGLKVCIDKCIPLGSGMGGGSSDAAATFVAVNTLWELGLSLEQMRTMAREIGMDVPFFLPGGCAVARGRGEQITPVAHNAQFFIVVVFPGFAISTREAYSRYDAIKCTPAQVKTDGILAALRSGSVEDVGNALFNVFEEVLASTYPELAKIKAQLLEMGCAGALLSGSGSAVYGLVREREAGEEMMKRLQGKYQLAHLAEPLDRGCEVSIGA
jgi:4-diphosphocytidyl-2-C-methyl-D-erythritol kinase